MQTDTKVGSKPSVGEADKERTNKLGLRGLDFIHLFFTYRRKNPQRYPQGGKKKKKEREI